MAQNIVSQDGLQNNTKQPILNYLPALKHFKTMSMLVAYEGCMVKSCPVREVYFLYHDATFARSDVEAPAWLADRTPAEVWCLGFRSLGRWEYRKPARGTLYGPCHEGCIVIFAMFVMFVHVVLIGSDKNAIGKFRES